MRANSLALRLFLSATAWTVVILVITGIVLSSIYRQAVERAFDRRLGVYLRTLVADVASPEEGSDKFPQSLGEPLFDLPLSGWYWQVTRLDTPASPKCARRARCGTAACRICRMRAPRWRRPDRAQGYVARPGRPEAAAGRAQHRSRRRGPLSVAVAGDAAEIADEIRSFDQRHRDHVCGARGRAAAHHHVSGAVRPRAAQAHLAKPRRDPLRPRRTARGPASRSRSRRSRARPMR